MEYKKMKKKPRTGIKRVTRIPIKRNSEIELKIGELIAQRKSNPRRVIKKVVYPTRNNIGPKRDFLVRL